jgi:hypothetical protein
MTGRVNNMHSAAELRDEMRTELRQQRERIAELEAALRELRNVSQPSELGNLYGSFVENDDWLRLVVSNIKD